MINNLPSPPHHSPAFNDGGGVVINETVDVGVAHVSAQNDPSHLGPRHSGHFVAILCLPSYVYNIMGMNPQATINVDWFRDLEIEKRLSLACDFLCRIYEGVIIAASLFIAGGLLSNLSDVGSLHTTIQELEDQAHARQKAYEEVKVLLRKEVEAAKTLREELSEVQKDVETAQSLKVELSKVKECGTVSTKLESSKKTSSEHSGKLKASEDCFQELSKKLETSEKTSQTLTEKVSSLKENISILEPF
ncbi:hypothetical protein TSUD_27520 [Trifolium subterraneum]|uniref:Uncharacterized protein n=1 Tax=Trifolium subterraneum TaxID=3900 RepID=A0A2Z6NNF0_TRISU|nr:hypothetical protein TSUD_27520 [Trifolium subterraneum]